jgi:hypothetical protein
MRKRVLALCVVAVVMLAGCAGVRPSGEPVTSTEIDSVLAALAESSPIQSAFRGTGEAEITLSGRTIKTTFVAIYERPGWLRADLRPSYGSLGSSLTAQALLEEGCARVYFPARLMEVSGCLSDLAHSASALDPAALVLGFPDASLVSSLDAVAGRRDGTTVFISGTKGEASVSVVIDERLPAVKRVEISGTDPNEVLVVSYDGYGWKDTLNIPQKVTLVAFEGTTHEIGVEVQYETARTLRSVDRTKHALSVPPGVLDVNWKDLSIWR